MSVGTPPSAVSFAGSPVHRMSCSPDCWWSTDNAGEALPGVITPLTWSFYADSLERAMKGTFFDMGVLPRRAVVASSRAEERLMDIYYGRAAANLNVFRYIGDCTPGTSGDAIEEQIFGQVRPGVSSRPVRTRYPVVAIKFPLAAARLSKRLPAAVDGVRPWRERCVAPGGLTDAAGARAALREASARFENVMRPHTMSAMLCQGLYDQLKQLAAAAGRPGLELDLATGYGDMAETVVVTDLWDVSRGRLKLDEFVRRHGFHGPEEGELSARVWRVRREPLEGLLSCYREMADDRDPRRLERARTHARHDAERQLLAALPRARRGPATLIMRFAARFIPTRGIGKAAFLQAVDVGRAATTVIGEQYARDGLLADPRDAFMFTLPELLAGPTPDAGELVTVRRAQHDAFRALDIPSMFSGVPESFPVEAVSSREGGAGTVVHGAPVSAGVVEGPARVLLSLEDAEIEPGDVLVCRTTDPSWASTMMLASAIVVDIGGPISHAAIVARELGVPCVIGTRDGTARIRTGDRLRVDGARGEVLVIG